MENVSIIAAIGRNNELGIGNDLIWHLPGDLKFFRNVTMGKDVVMGSKTFYSLPKVLPGRRHIILTSKNIDHEQVVLMRTKEELLQYLNHIKKEVMIIGGASIYAQMLEYVDTMYLTHIDATMDQADAYFPEFLMEEWNQSLLGMNEDNGISYKHVLYKRRK